MRAEMKSGKWLAKAILLQIGVGYTVAMVVNQVGTIIAYGHLAPGFAVSIVILDRKSVV